MGSMMNGMAAHGGVIPCGITFLVFSDYERPAQRMAAMMGLPVKFLFTHDSIGIGKNGPTHQPVEMLASLRAIPNMLVLRPADAVEMAECWEIMLHQRARPASLIASRQAVPTLRHAHTEENQCSRGAYILADAQGGDRRVTLFATGSEVSIALNARKLLQAQQIPTAVVSVPSWELFEEQDDTYRARIIGRGTLRVAIEAARKLGWERFIGEDGLFFGMSTFGQSGPTEQIFERFGITSERVVSEVRTRLQ
jgi:transketolase